MAFLFTILCILLFRAHIYGNKISLHISFRCKINKAKDSIQTLHFESILKCAQKLNSPISSRRRESKRIRVLIFRNSLYFGYSSYIFLSRFFLSIFLFFKINKFANLKKIRPNCVRFLMCLI